MDIQGKHRQIETPCSDYAGAYMGLSSHCLHMSGWPFSPMSIHTTATTTTATTSAYNNDNSPNMRNGSF